MACAPVCLLACPHPRPTARQPRDLPRALLVLIFSVTQALLLTESCRWQQSLQPRYAVWDCQTVKGLIVSDLAFDLSLAVNSKDDFRRSGRSLLGSLYLAQMVELLQWYRQDPPFISYTCSNAKAMIILLAPFMNIGQCHIGGMS